jgi:hypothetical protein
MKKVVFVLVSAVALLFTACSKDDNNGILLQAHDQNRMMDSMHAMMDRNVFPSNPIPLTSFCFQLIFTS